MTNNTGNDNLIRVGGTKMQYHEIELPTGAVVVGMGIVYVRLDGDVSAILRCAGRDRRDRQVFYSAVSAALEDFRVKHGLSTGTDGGEFGLMRKG